MKNKYIIRICIILSLVINIILSNYMLSFANTGGPGVINNTSTTNIVKGENGIPGSVIATDIDPNLNLDEVVAGADLNLLGGGNISPDAVLGETPWLYYGMMNINNHEIISTQSIQNNYLYNKDGFSRLYIDHHGMGKYYYRAYTAAQGWFPWSYSTQATPNAYENDKIQAIQIRMKGYPATRADIYYKAVLNDGTVLDWAKNGETMGSIGTGRFIVALKVVLWDKNTEFPGKRELLTQSTKYDGIYLDSEGNLSYSTADNSPYTGWAFYGDNQYYFSNGSKLNGWHYIDGYKYFFNEDGSIKKDLQDVMGLTNDYQIKHNKATKTTYIMAKDGTNGYIIPYKTFMTANGPDTPLGTFKTYAKYRWKIMHDNIYCQFLTRFNGPFLMHSLIYYDKADSNRLDPATYNYMDAAVSNGCLRFRAVDASWIYNNAPLKTTVHIYSNAWDKGPVEKDEINMPIPKNQNYDPTDPIFVSN